VVFLDALRTAKRSEQLARGMDYTQVTGMSFEQLDKNIDEVIVIVMRRQVWTHTGGAVG
jgi:hypothetical protein